MSAPAATDTPVTVTSLIANMISPQPRGTSVYWATQVVGGSGALEYKFWMYSASSGRWFVVQQYGSSNSVSWPMATPGTYWVQVWVRTVGSGAEYEAWANSAVLVIE